MNASQGREHVANEYQALERNHKLVYEFFGVPDTNIEAGDLTTLQN